MTLSKFLSALRTSSPSISWKQTGKLQQTLASSIERTGITLHSGESSTAKLFPAMAGEGRFFICGDHRIPASIDFAKDTALCTTLCKQGVRVRMVEHLLSALEGLGVDNCRIEIVGADEVPLLDGSAREWVEEIEKVGVCVAKDCDGNSMDKLAPYLHEPVHVWKNDSFVAAFPSPKVHITYGINFPQMKMEQIFLGMMKMNLVPAIDCQWFSTAPMDNFSYVEGIASSRTFCIYEELIYFGGCIVWWGDGMVVMLGERQWGGVRLFVVEKLRNIGLIKGGSEENAIICSVTKGWLNPPLRFQDEPCRHKVLDLVGDFSLLAQNGSQGLPVAHIVSYKGGHSLNAEFVRHLSRAH